MLIQYGGRKCTAFYCNIFDEMYGSRISAMLVDNGRFEQASCEGCGLERIYVAEIHLTPRLCLLQLLSAMKLPQI
jgi:hypothetical protein